MQVSLPSIEAHLEFLNLKAFSFTDVLVPLIKIQLTDNMYSNSV